MQLNCGAVCLHLSFHSPIVRRLCGFRGLRHGSLVHPPPCAHMRAYITKAGLLGLELHTSSTKKSPKSLFHFTHPGAVYEDSCFSVSSSVFGIVRLLNFCHLVRVK